MEKIDVLCDSSSLISLTDSCLDNILGFLANNFNIRFIIPNSVEDESVNRPLTSHIRQYSFSALKIKKAINDNIIVKVKNGQETHPTVDSILYMTNNMFFVRGKPLKLVHLGEAEMIALAEELDVNSILIDERTTRMLIEAPFQLKEHLEEEFSTNVMVNRDNLTKFSDLTKGMEAIRSTELLILAYENGYFDGFGEIKRDVLEAALYKLKFSGCSIRFDEITDFMKSIMGETKNAAVP